MKTRNTPAHFSWLLSEVETKREEGNTESSSIHDPVFSTFLAQTCTQKYLDFDFDLHYLLFLPAKAKAGDIHHSSRLSEVRISNTEVRVMKNYFQYPASAV